MLRPLAIDLCCGLGGWAEGLLIEGYDVIGFDVEQHVYGEHCYPGLLVIQNILTLHGSQFRNADLIVASPPCQEYSYMAMPWKRAKAKAAAIRADESGQKLEVLNRLFNACFRIQKEASLAAGRHIPLVVENVRGAIPWVGRSRWNFGSFHLWGDVPAPMPSTTVRNFKGSTDKRDGTGRFTACSLGRQSESRDFFGPGKSFQSESVNRYVMNGRKVGMDWFGNRDNSKSKARKMTSAMIAKIPLPLSRQIAMAYRDYRFLNQTQSLG